MATKVIIFLAFATLAQSSTFVPSLKVTFGLSATEATILQEIIVNQEATRNAYVDTATSLFDILRKSAAGLIAGTTVSSDDATTAIDEAICSAKNATEITYNSITLAAGTSCSAAETAYSETCSYVENALAAVEALFELAKCGSFFDNQTLTESYQSTIQETLENIINAEYDSITTCLDITDSDALEVIAKTRAGSILAVTHLTNAFSNAIKVYAAAVCDRFSSATLLCDLEAFLVKMLTAHRDNVEFTFSTIRTVFINAKLGKSGIVKCVADSQYTDIVAFRGYRDGNIALFTGIDEALDRISLGISDDGGSYVSKEDIRLANVIATFDAGDYRLNDNILFIHPENNATIAESRASIHASNIAIDQAFSEAFSAAVNSSANYTGVLANIEVLRHEAVDPAAEYTGLFYNLYRGNLTLNATLEAQLVSLQNQTTSGAQISTGAYLDAVVMVANATHNGAASSSDYATSADLLLEAYDALEDFTQSLAAAGLLVCNYINES